MGAIGPQELYSGQIRVAQNLRGRVAQVLFVSIYLGAVLGTFFEPQPNSCEHISTLLSN